MATRGPPPPPPHGATPMGHQNAAPLNQQRPQFQQQQGPQQQSQFRQGAPIRPVQVVNPTKMIFDLRPQVALTEEFARRQLTTYEAHTFTKEPLINDRDLRETRVQKKDSRRKSDSKPKGTWQLASSSLEPLEQETLRETIRRLDKRGKLSLTQKKSALTPDQNDLINRLLLQRNNDEYDNAFTWTLRQLERTGPGAKREEKRDEKKDSKKDSKRDSKKSDGKSEIDSLMVYIKRGPRPDVDPLIVYRNIQKMKVQQNRAQQQMQDVQADPRMFPNQAEGQARMQPQRVPQNGHDQGQQQGRMPTARFPPNQEGRMPAEVHVVQEDVGGMGRPQATGRYAGGKGNKNEIIEIVEDDRAHPPRRRSVSRNNKNRRKGTRYHSDDSRSGNSSDNDSGSGSDSDGSPVYSDTDTNATSVSSGDRRRRRRDSGYHDRLKSLPRKQHEKHALIVEKGRRHSVSAYAPDPPQRRTQSYERTSFGAVGHDPVVSEIFAAGVMAAANQAAKAAVAERIRAPSPRQIAYHDDLLSQRSSRTSPPRSLDEGVHIYDEIRLPGDNLRRRDSIRPVDEYARRESRDDFALREESRLREERLQEARLREVRLDELRLDDLERDRREDFIPSEEFRLRDNLRRAEELVRRNSMASPRFRAPEFARRGRLEPLPLEPTRQFDYVRNPHPQIPVRHVPPKQDFFEDRNPFTPREQFVPRERFDRDFDDRYDRY